MIIYQTENMGNRFEYRTSGHDNWVKPPHIHEYSELAFVTEGVATIYLSGKKYLVEAGHAILILPNLVHEYTDETASHLQCAVFSNDHIPAFFEAVGNGELECPIVDLSDEPFIAASAIAIVHMVSSVYAHSSVNSSKLKSLVLSNSKRDPTISPIIAPIIHSVK